MNFDSTFYSTDSHGFITTRKERKAQHSRTSAYGSRRASKPRKAEMSTVDTALHFAAKDMGIAKEIFLGRKSDFIASAEPTDRSSTIIMIDGVPHKKKDGKYVGLKFKSSTEPLVSTAKGVAEMYQHLLLLEDAPEQAMMFEEFLALASQK